MKYLWKGLIVDKEDIHIDIMDRGYQFGDGIYEVAHVYNGVLFALEDHINRLIRSANLIEMNLKHTYTDIEKMFLDLVKENEIQYGYVYLQVTRGDEDLRNHAFRVFDEQEPVFSGFGLSSKINRKNMENGVEGITVEDRRSTMCHVKSLNLLPNCLAKNAAKKAGVSKALMVRDGVVTEEKSGNILMVKDGVVYTHPDGTHILPGITKKHILLALEDESIPFKEECYTQWDLSNADEIMVTDTNSEIVPVIRLNGQQIGNGKRGPITEKIQTAYQLMVEKECGAIDK